MMNQRLRADFALVVCALIWGATFVVIKDALRDMSVIAYVAVRFGIAAVLMAMIYWRAVRALTLREVWAGAQIGIFMFAGYMFQITGLRWTTPSKAAFVTGMYVVFVPIVQAIFGARRISVWIWSGALAALAGLYFLSVPPEGLGRLNRGDPIVFGCALMFAFHMIFISRNVEKYSVASLSFLQVATTAVLATVLVPIAAEAGWEQPKLRWTPFVIFAVLATAIGATVICFSLQTWAQKHTSASRAAILLTLEPVFAAVTSVTLGGERIGARALLGALLIFAGILVAEWKGSTERRPGEIPA
ncbi:MAG TPA: DMT family transporter [Candidatus Acidoferrales bacterium]|jgi:drug/metabolite transporter (DMT)-like permease|nr:DMT family transporter [Candidatus Acidoferrales bacterium]